MYTKEQLNKYWEDTLNKLESTFNNPLLFNDIYAPTKIYKLNKNILYVLANDSFAQNELTINKIFIEQIFNQIANLSVAIQFITDEDIKNLKITKETSTVNVAPITTPKIVEEEVVTATTLIDPQLTFKNFIVGDFNKDSYRLLLKILETGESLFNPIYIYGSTGLGKTHLVSAFSNEFVKKFPNKKIHFIESNTFVKEILNALYKGNNEVENIKNKYSECDILIMEDIQYLSEKAKTNEIFFNIFNNILKNRKTIIMTSDCSTSELSGFEERMISRLSSGITTKIKSPKSNVLIDLIGNYLDTESVKLTDNAMEFLINHFNNDIRKLNGILNKLIFFTNVNETEINIIDEDKLIEILDLDSIKNKKVVQVNPNSVINAVAKLYNLKLQDIIGKSRKKSPTVARHVAMYILREIYQFQLKEIGSIMSNRDHTTILNGVSKIKEQLSQDKELELVINNLVKSLK